LTIIRDRLWSGAGQPRLVC